MRAAPLLVLVLLAAGCVAPVADVAPASLGSGGVLVADPDGEPVPYAAATMLVGGVPVARVSSGPDGLLRAGNVAFDEMLVEATGYASARITPEAARGTITLAPATVAPLADDPVPGLRMLPPVDFGAFAWVDPQTCAAYNCGLSEPVVEVAGDGSIYVSSTCCVGAAPPVWVSRDGGATFTTLDTPGVREAVGIEGDFAIDDAGNVYFTDILLGAMWMTSWGPDGAWRHTTPVPLPPLVDRPWVRAGAEEVVYFLYNTGSSTNFHVSTDGGRTFLPVATKEFPAALGTFAQGPERDHLWVFAGGFLYESADGGATWSAGEEVPRPDDAKDDEGRWNFAVPVVDEAGRVLVAFDHGNEERGYAIHAAIREPDGAWSVHPVSAPGGTHHMPWPAAGPDGGFVIAWYGTDESAASPDTVNENAAWYVLLASSHDAGETWQTVRADPEAIAYGPLNRRLLDFLQLDVGPEGAAHLVYAHNREASDKMERTNYVRTTVGLGLAPVAYPHGPKDAAEAARDALGLVALE